MGNTESFTEHLNIRCANTQNTFDSLDVTGSSFGQFRRRDSGTRSREISTTNLTLMKTIYIQVKNGERIAIEVPRNEQTELTCGWLLSEAIRQLAMNSLITQEERDSIVALETVNGIITLDYWLTELQRSISILRDQIVLRPVFGDFNYTVGKEKININYFQILKLIGTGGTSKVYLARRKDNGRFYAIKVIIKHEVIELDKEEILFNERNIMVRLDHPFLSKLHFVFQTADKIFIVMDFFPGGELFYHLSYRKSLTEAEAKIYVGQVVLALNYLHKNNIIYRDLKPENILLDLDGNLHLTDFGLCKLLSDKNQLNYSVCGSPDYLAPEVLTRRGYTTAVDFYGLGMLVYELVCGQPPFTSYEQSSLYEEILNSDVEFPDSLSPKLKLFLSQLLVKDPAKRLGSKGGFSDIVNHPWCADIDFVKIASKKMKVPILPKINETNFAKEFVQVDITHEAGVFGDPNMVNNDSLAHYFNDLERNRNETMFVKFANFSFYSNIEDPYTKYPDSIFLVTEEEAPSNSQEATEKFTLTKPERMKVKTPLDDAEIKRILVKNNENLLEVAKVSKRLSVPERYNTPSLGLRRTPTIPNNKTLAPSQTKESLSSTMDLSSKRNSKPKFGVRLNKSPTQLRTARADIILINSKINHHDHTISTISNVESSSNSFAGEDKGRGSHHSKNKAMSGNNLANILLAKDLNQKAKG